MFRIYVKKNNASLVFMIKLQNCLTIMTITKRQKNLTIFINYDNTHLKFLKLW